MKDTLRWSYALNQWNYRMDIFVRHEHQLRALKATSALGFDRVELAAGMGGRWDNLGRPEVMIENHGSPQGVLDFLAQGTVRGISSLFWDPGMPAEEGGFAFLMSVNPEHHDQIVEAAKPFVDFAAAAGAEQLVVRPSHSAWMVGPADEGRIALLAQLWNRVGALAASSGVGLSVHYDCLGSIHTREQLEAFLAATDPELVGLALDTAEFAIAGIDPVAFYRDHHERVTHVHLKNTLFADTGEEYLMPGAEQTMLQGGAGRRIERWICELGAEGGLVDAAAFVAALREHDYAGWVVVESDRAGNPAEMTMLNSWFVQHELGASR